MLLLRCYRVSHNPRIMPRVCYDSDNPLCVAQTGASEQQVVAGQRYLATIGLLDNSFILVNLVIGHFADDCALELSCGLFLIIKLSDALGSVLVLKICLAIEVFRLDECHIFRFGRG